LTAEVLPLFCFWFWFSSFLSRLRFLFSCHFQWY